MSFTTGLSGIRAHQTALAVIGNNIVNSNTPGFHRQEVRFTESPSVDIGGHLIGTGVTIASIEQAKSMVAEEALTRAISDGAGAASKLDTARRLESLFAQGSGSLHGRLETFFNALEDLSSEPHDPALRRTVVDSAEDLAAEVNRVSDELNTISAGVANEVQGVVDTIASLTEQIGSLNSQINQARGRGENPLALISNRDQLVNELAQYVDVQKRTDAQGTDYFVVADVYILNEDPIHLNVVQNDDGVFEVWKEGCDKPIPIHGGVLGGLVGANNEAGGVGELTAELENLTTALIEKIDSAHAFGLGLNGPFESLRSQRSAEATDVPLQNANLALNVEAGSLFISVTESATGETSLAEVAIDPSTQSLEDVAAAISAVDNLSAIVDPGGGTLMLVADAGFGFDFTGSMQDFPDPSGITGTTVPRIEGRYRGPDNDELTFTFLGSGAIGAADDLRLEVRDGSGAILNILDVGNDYEPGSLLSVSDGIEVALDPGSANLNDTFQVRAIREPDETGFLAAMGLNTLFAGSSPQDLSVNESIVENSSRLATTTTGDPSDTTNLQRMIELRDERFLAEGTQTFGDFLAALAASTGREVNELTQMSQASEELQQSLRDEMAAVSGVDINEELARMLQMQRGFQASAHYISVVDDSLQELFNITR